MKETNTAQQLKTVLCRNQGEDTPATGKVKRPLETGWGARPGVLAGDVFCVGLAGTSPRWRGFPKLCSLCAPQAVHAELSQAAGGEQASPDVTRGGQCPSGRLGMCHFWCLHWGGSRRGGISPWVLCAGSGWGAPGRA